MKKTIILGALLISTLSFANGYNSQNGMGRNYPNRAQTKASSLSNEQLAKLDALREENFQEHQSQILEIEGKNIEIESLLAESKVDWNAVKKLTKEVSEIEAKIELDMLKTHEEVEEITGDEYPQMRMGLNNQDGMRGQGNNSERNMGNRQASGNRSKTGKSFDGIGMRDGNRGNIQGNGVERDVDVIQARYGSNLTDEQISKIDEIRANEREQNDKLLLEVASDRNKIQKLLLEDEINWTSIEKLVSNSAEVKSAVRLNNFAAREAIEEITGSEIIRSGNRGFKGNMQNNGNFGNGNRKGMRN